MPRHPDPTSALAFRLLSRYEILAIILLRNAGHKGVRIANALNAPAGKHDA